MLIWRGMGESTLEMADMRMYHLILIDIHLNKDLNCYQLIDCIEEKSKFNQFTPIILLSAAPHQEQLKNNNIHPCFAKPMNQKDVKKVIDYLEEYQKNK